MSKNAPVTLTDAADESTFKSCATEVFRWLRASIDLIEQSPAYIHEVSDDLFQAWHDSAKR